MKNKKQKPLIERAFCFFYGILFIDFSLGMYLGGSINPISDNWYLFLGLGFLGLLMGVLERQRLLFGIIIIALISFSLGVLI